MLSLVKSTHPREEMVRVFAGSEIATQLVRMGLPMTPELSARLEQEYPYGMDDDTLPFLFALLTVRVACPHVNQDTQYANVTFIPAPARAAYRAAP